MITTDDIKSWIEHAPPATPGPDGLLGFTSYVDGRQQFVCSDCHSRIIGRGCRLPSPTGTLWGNQEQAPNCLACGKGNDGSL